MSKIIQKSNILTLQNTQDYNAKSIPEFCKQLSPNLNPFYTALAQETPNPDLSTLTDMYGNDPVLVPFYTSFSKIRDFIFAKGLQQHNTLSFLLENLRKIPSDRHIDIA